MFDIKTFNVKKYDEILSKGLSRGLGNRKGTMCIEAAICAALDLPHGDDPGCVIRSARLFKIQLNDSKEWSSEKARASGLRNLGLAQLGSLGIVNNVEFVSVLSKKITKIMIPKLENSGYRNTHFAIDYADKAVIYADKAADAAAYADYAAAYAANAAIYAAEAAGNDEFLILAADLATETFKELNSPGCTLL